MIDGRKRTRLAVLLFAAVVAAMTAAGAFYLSVRPLVSERVWDWMQSPAYQQQRSEDAYRSLQTYVREQGIALSDLRPISGWEQRNPYSLVFLYAGDRLIYGTGIPQEDLALDAEQNPEALAPQAGKVLQFKDGSAGLSFYHYDALQYDWLVTFSVGITAFALFVLLMLLPINRKMRYLRTLKEELKILEGGGLEHPLSIRGRDEIAEVAQGIEQMRLSLLSQQREREAAQQANAELVAAVSHDLRTPLTSLSAYLDLLAQEGRHTQEQRAHYLRSARDKATQLKDMSDALFDYFYVYAQEESAPMEELDADAVLGQMLGEMALDLKSAGFEVEQCTEPLHGRLLCNPQLLSRAFGNLLSNLRKYADPGQEIWLSCVREGTQAVIRAENSVTRQPETAGTGIGLKSLERVLAAHGGSLRTAQQDGRYQSTLRLPLRPD